MDEYSEGFIGMDVSKSRIAVALAEGGRAGEVRFLGEIEASDSAVTGRPIARSATSQPPHEAARSLRRRLKSALRERLHATNVAQRRGRSRGRGIQEDCKWQIIDRRPYEGRESPGRNLGNAVPIRA